MKLRTLTCCALLALLTGGCVISTAARSSQAPEGAYRIYYAVSAADSQGAAVDYEYWAPEGEDDLVRSLLAAALSAPEETRLISPYPEGVSLRGLSLEEGVLEVDLSEQYGELSGVDLTIANYCLTLTLCQVPEVQAVHITVEGAELPYFSGKELRAEDVVLTGNEEQPVYMDAALWFADAGGDGLRVELRQILKTEDATSPEAVLDALIAGPEEQGLYNLIPAGTAVRSAVTDGGLCVVDFSGEFLDGSGQDERRDRMLLYAVVNTLAGSLENIEQVRIFVEGEPIDALGGVSLDSPIKPDFNLELGTTQSSTSGD